MNQSHLATPAGKPRARALGIPLEGDPGPLNAITDVPGLQVGYATLIRGDDVRTGVTIIHPRGPQASADPVAAGFHSHNGNGEMTGVSWIRESGTFAGPVGITSTHAVGVVHAAIIAWAARHHPEMAEGWLLPVVGETWDGYLHDANGQHITEAVVRDALDASAGGAVEEGSVGGGTGMSCYQYKGGSGTASRRVALVAGPSFTVGVFVQANFGRRRELSVAGVPLGRILPDDPRPAATAGAGSAIAVVATDAPLLPGQLEAMARRVPMGLARTGTTGSHFSGDLCLAFSTANPGAFRPGRRAAAEAGLRHLSFIPWEAMDPLLAAAAYATEEAVLNALVANSEAMQGRDGHVSPALPRELVAAHFARRDR